MARNSEADEIHDGKILCSAVPSRHVAIVPRFGKPVEVTQIIRPGAGQILLYNDLRGEELGAAFALILEALADPQVPPAQTRIADGERLGGHVELGRRITPLSTLRVHVRPARSIFSDALNLRCSAMAALVLSP